MDFALPASKSMPTSHQPHVRSFSNLSYLFGSICLVHCLAMPFVVLLLPALAHFVSDTLELILILSIIPVSLFAFIPTWKKHKNPKLLASFAVGLTLILVGQFLMNHYHEAVFDSNFVQSDAFGHFLGRTSVMLLGVITLAISIYKNNKHTHVCRNPHHHH